MRILRAADYRRMPWKNGGGETLEIAVSPEGASMDDFDWRLSIALVGVDGPFSAFPEIDRTLTVIEGAGIDLRVGDAAPARLTPGAPYAFPGDVACMATLVAGGIADFNVMTRRGRYAHEVRRVGAGDTLRAPADGLTVFLALEEGAEIRAGGEAVVLSPRDTLFVPGQEEAGITQGGGLAAALRAV